jgi:hypothetical protein
VFYDDCDFPYQFSYFIGAHAVLFFILFAEFYIKAYVMPKTKKLKVRFKQFTLMRVTREHLLKGMAQYSQPH